MGVSRDNAARREHALDAEQAVLGSFLIDTNIQQQLFAQVRPEDFLSPTNRKIYTTARALFRAGEPVDGVTVRDKLGQDYTGPLMELMEITPTSANWEVYAAIMRDQAAHQRLRDLAEHVLEQPNLESCRPYVADMGQVLSAGPEADSWTMRQMADDFFNGQDPDTPAPKYITYGLDVLDNGSYTELGDVVIIGGYPSDGKTALALSMAYHMAAEYKVGFFSLETDKRKIRDRLMAHIGQISLGDIKRRRLIDPDWVALAAKGPEMAKRDLTVVQAAGMTAPEIQSVAQAYGFQVILIDYIQLVTPETDRRAPRSEQVAEVSRSFHTFAQRTGTLVVELAQLTRPDKGTWRPPTMQDLKESGQLEQDADMIVLLYRPDPEDKTLDQNDNRSLKIGKNKEGRRGTWLLSFDGERQTFALLGGDGKPRRRPSDRKRRKQDEGQPGQVDFWADGGEFKDAPWGQEASAK